MKSFIKQRQSNIELLRILSISGVIFLHYCHKDMGGAFAYVQPNSANYFLLYALMSLFICAVDLFMLISGYFLCTTKHRNFWKPIELLSQVVLLRVGVYLLSCLRPDRYFTLSALARNCIPSNYFVILYIAVYIVSPFINIIFEKLTKKQMKTFILVLMAIFSVYPTMVDVFSELTSKEYVGLSTIGAYGSQWGYSIANFVLMYIIGAYLRLGLPDNFKPSKIRITAGVACCIILLTGWAVFNDITGFFTERSAWEYCNPIVILSAVFIFLLFKNINMGSSKLINRISESVFSVYLLHSALLKYLNVESFVAKNPFILFCHICVSIIGIYLACTVVHHVYSAITKPIFRKLSQWIKLPVLDLSD